MITNITTKYKQSKQRNALLQILSSTKSHPTAQWLYDALKATFPQLSLGTVYRNLSILADQGAVKVLHGGSTFDHFDADTSLHYHIECTVCRRIDDAPVSSISEIKNSSLESSGYKITSHALTFYGICPDCQKAERVK